ncbi:MAG: hypothetical protein HYS81_03050 [Candidatus Aenigmatarchaeota archaeon]|nr:MAG: hypothetical protein HYS81_03050 [Candidatus Aenigmarchaeota archaeon]
MPRKKGATSVDDLLDLINERRNVELHEAATVLNVDPDTIEEWAEAMSDQGLMEIDYGFGKVTLKAIAPAAFEEKGKEAMVRKTDVSKKATTAEQRALEIKKKVTYTAKDIEELGKTIEEHGKEAEGMVYDVKQLFAEGEKFLNELDYRKISAEQREREMLEKFNSLETSLHASEKRLAQIIKEFEQLDATVEDIFKRAHAHDEEVRALETMKGEITKDMKKLESEAGILIHYEEKVSPSVLQTLKRLVMRVLEKLEYVLKKKVDVSAAHKETHETIQEARERFGIEQPEKEFVGEEETPTVAEKPEQTKDAGRTETQKQQQAPESGEEAKKDETTAQQEGTSKQVYRSESQEGTSKQVYRSESQEGTSKWPREKKNK